MMIKEGGEEKLKHAYKVELVIKAAAE